MKKRMMSLFLGASLAAGTAAAAAPPVRAEVSASQIEERLVAAEAVWPDGTVYIDRFDDGCSQCFGFLREIFFHVFDKPLPTMWETSDATFANCPQLITLVAHLEDYTLDELKSALALAQPGDVLIAANTRTNHGVFIRSAAADGSGVFLYDANWTKNSEGEPMLRSNGWWSAEDIHRQRPVAVSIYRSPDAASAAVAPAAPAAPAAPETPATVEIEDPQPPLAEAPVYAPSETVQTSPVTYNVFTPELPEDYEDPVSVPTPFTDVTVDAWYAPYVSSVSSQGLMQGVSADTFDPSGSLSLLQTIVLGARVHSMNAEIKPDFSMPASGIWYQPYLEYAVRNNLINAIYGDVNRPATRLEVAEILSAALTEDALTVINQIADGAIPDVPGDATGADAVYRLYRAGILTGGEDGSFSPYAPVLRSEAAAAISRVTERERRVSFRI